jgi:hypothetical protein
MPGGPARLDLRAHQGVVLEVVLPALRVADDAVRRAGVGSIAADTSPV